MKNVDPRQQIGQQIRTAREAKGLTQLALAKKLGCTYQLLQRYERGEKLTLDRIVIIAAVLEIESTVLLTVTDSWRAAGSPLPD